MSPWALENCDFLPNYFLTFYRANNESINLIISRFINNGNNDFVYGIFLKPAIAPSHQMNLYSELCVAEKQIGATAA